MKRVKTIKKSDLRNLPVKVKERLIMIMEKIPRVESIFINGSNYVVIESKETHSLTGYWLKDWVLKRTLKESSQYLKPTEQDEILAFYFLNSPEGRKYLYTRYRIYTHFEVGGFIAHIGGTDEIYLYIEEYDFTDKEFYIESKDLLKVDITPKYKGGFDLDFMFKRSIKKSPVRVKLSNLQEVIATINLLKRVGLKVFQKNQKFIGEIDLHQRASFFHGGGGS